MVADRVKRELAAEIGELHNRRSRLEFPPPLDVVNNSSFELPLRRGLIPGWSVTAAAGDQATLDATDSHAGRQSLHLQSRGGDMALRSDPFATPHTGRLAVSVWLKIPPGASQPRLRLVLEGAAADSAFYRTAPLGEGPGVVPIPDQWKQIIFAIDDLPTDAPRRLRFRVDLLGAGDVWLDDVQSFDLVFTDAEKIQLSKIIALAEFQLESGRLGDCLYELEGYWPRLLDSQVPLSPEPLVAAPANAPSPKSPSEKSAARPGMLDRLKDAWKF